MTDIDFYAPKSGQVVLAAHGLILSRASLGTGVVNGNRITPTAPPSMDIIVEEGRITIEGEGSDVLESTPTLDPSDETLDRVDLIYRDINGAVQVIKGSLGVVEDPQESGDWTHYTSPQPSDNIPDGAILGTVYIPHGATAISAADIWMFAGRTVELSADIEDAVAKRHTQNTDQFLDAGGANQVSAAQAKNAADKAHTQNADQYLDYGGANQSAVADVKDAITKKHTQASDDNFDGLTEDTSPGREEYLPLKKAAGYRKVKRKYLLPNGGVLPLAVILDGGGGNAIEAGQWMDIHVVVPGTLTKWILEAQRVAGQSNGSIDISLYKCTYAQYDDGVAHPVVADSIVASDHPKIVSAVKGQGTALTDWTKALSNGDVIRVVVNSCTNLTKCTLTLEYEAA